MVALYRSGARIDYKGSCTTMTWCRTTDAKPTTYELVRTDKVKSTAAHVISFSELDYSEKSFVPLTDL